MWLGTDKADFSDLLSMEPLEKNLTTPQPASLRVARAFKKAGHKLLVAGTLREN